MEFRLNLFEFEWAKGFWWGCHHTVNTRVDSLKLQSNNGVKIFLKFLKNRQKMQKNAFLACFRAYIGKPHSHICWATSMPFTSFNPTNPGTNLRNFREKFLRIGDFDKWAFFESAILNFFFLIFFFFASFPWKSAQIYMVEWMGQNFDIFPGFQKIPCHAQYCVIQCM